MTIENKLPWMYSQASDGSWFYEVPEKEASELHDMREHTVKRLMEVIDVQEKRLA